MLKLAAAAALPVSLAAATVASTSFLVVDVRPADGPHIVVPVPLILAQAALSFVPAQEARIEMPEEAREALPMARRIVAALRDIPDAELVHVEERGEEVVVRKVGDHLEVRVHSDDEDIEVDLPLEAAAAALEGDLRDPVDAARGVVRSLRRMSRTDLVEVHSGGDHVKVWVW